MAIGTDKAWTRKCTVCGKQYAYYETVWRCSCGGILRLDSMVPFAGSAREPGIWRYGRSLPPIPSAQRISLGEGTTPLVRLSGLPGDVCGKLEFACPTGSFKDRGMTVLVSRLHQLGITEVVEDSSGNAGASLAAYCAAAGIACTIYVPAAASGGKLTQLRAYGASTILVPGPRSVATEAALKAAETVYYANHIWDPYFSEGTKTAAFEMVEQLEGNAPGRVLLPVGQGTMLLGLAKGFAELIERGLINKMPELVVVQSDACAPLYDIFHEHLKTPPRISTPRTMLAEGIASANPFRWQSMVEVVRSSAGTVIRVSDAEIPSAVVALGRLGVFVEPTSATVLLALRQLLDESGGSLPGTTVLVLTGSGLKATGIVDSWFGSAAKDRPSRTVGSPDVRPAG